MSGQWEPGLILHACAMTEEGQEFLSLDTKPIVAVINPEEDNDSVARLACSQNQNNEELPEEELDSEEARQFGEKLCERSASDWSAAQLKDETARIAIQFILSC